MQKKHKVNACMLACADRRSVLGLSMSFVKTAIDFERSHKNQAYFSNIEGRKTLLILLTVSKP